MLLLLSLPLTMSLENSDYLKILWQNTDVEIQNDQDNESTSELKTERTLKKLIECTREEIVSAAQTKREKILKLLVLPENTAETDTAIFEKVDEIVESSVRLVASFPRASELSVEQLQRYQNLASSDIENVIKVATEKRKYMLPLMAEPKDKASPYHIFIRFEKSENIFTRLSVVL
jgi:hypothetical protein